LISQRGEWRRIGPGIAAGIVVCSLTVPTQGSALDTGLGGERIAESPPSDPLNSPGWGVVRERFFKGREVRFDDRVVVLAPKDAEDPLDVPVTVSAAGLDDVQNIVVIADLNPIQKILELRPVRALPGLSFRFKVEQSTPIRAAMRTTDGVWHVGGVWLSAAGGGCTTASGASRGLWRGEVGEMNGRLWLRGSGAGTGANRIERLRLRIVHPMDTGLASGIPAFYMDHLVIRDGAGAILAVLDTYEPIAENPVVSLDLHNGGPVHVEGHDIQGNTFTADVRP
jgi:sulfur-oxidizing protein SoxY